MCEFREWLPEHMDELSTADQWTFDDVEKIYNLAKKETAERCIEIVKQRELAINPIGTIVEKIKSEFL